MVIAEYDIASTLTSHANPVWAVGVLLEAFATLAACIGKQFFRYAATSNNNNFYFVGIFLVSIIDPIFDLSAYTFAAQSIIAPCAGMIIVWNVMLAPIVLKERLTRTRLVAAAIVTLGTVCTGMFGNHDEFEYRLEDYIELFTRPAACSFYFCFLVCCGLAASKYVHGDRTQRATIMAGLGGALAGNTYPTKAAVELFMCLLPRHEAVVGCTPNPFLSSVAPYYFVLLAVVLACTAIGLLALSLRENDALFMITVYEGCMVATGAISGNVVLDEWQGQTSTQLVMYTMSILLVLAGLTLLIHGENAVAMIGTEQQRLMLTVGAGAAKAKEWGGRAREWGGVACSDGARVTRRAWEHLSTHGVSAFSQGVDVLWIQGVAAYERAVELWVHFRQYEAPGKSAPESA